MTQDELLRPRDVPESLVLTLEIEGRDVVLDASADDDESNRNNADDRDDPDGDDENDDYRPQIFIFSSGDISPFTFQLRGAFQNTGISMEVAGDGTVEFTEGPM